MGSFAFPQNNPTGVTGAGTFNTSTGFNAIPPSGTGVGGAGNMGFGNSMNPMPQTPSTSGGAAQPMTASSYVSQSPAVSSQPGANVPNSWNGSPAVAGSNNPYGQTNSQQYWTQDYLEKTFGGGMGSLVYQYLMSNGGFNSQITGKTVDATSNAMQRQNQLGENNVSSTLSSMGVTGGSSSMGDALSTYENQAKAQENAITAQDYYQMWNESQQNELNMMQFAATGTGKTLANKPNWMDYASLGLGAVGAAGSVMTGIGLLDL